MHRSRLLLTVALSAALPALAQTDSPFPLPAPPAGVLVGFNQNWSQLPALSGSGGQRVLANVAALRPQLLRYPGGTVTHSWDWQSGRVTTRTRAAPHPIADVGTLARATGAGVVFCLDVVNRSVNDQIAMLRAAQAQGVKIAYVELGNELYAQDRHYEQSFPTGAEYAALANAWTPALKAAFPGVKVSAVLLGREVKATSRNARVAGWNAAVTAHVSPQLDAFTYHVYVPEGGTAVQTTAAFARVARATPTGDRELWITEYGDINPPATPGYLGDVRALATFLETFPRVTIALNHQLVGTHMSKLTPDGSAVTAEGRVFLNRER